MDAAEAITVAARPHTRCSPSPADGRAQIGIGGHDPGPGRQRQCQTANRDSLAMCVSQRFPRVEHKGITLRHKNFEGQLRQEDTA